MTSPEKRFSNLSCLAVVVLNLLLRPLGLMLVWDAIMPDVFGFRTITFVQSVGLVLLVYFLLRAIPVDVRVERLP